MDHFTTLMRPALPLPETHMNAEIQILMVETMEMVIILTAEPLESITIDQSSLFNPVDLTGLSILVGQIDPTVLSILVGQIDPTVLSEKVEKVQPYRVTGNSCNGAKPRFL